jgi:hypothetical protein
VRCARDGGNRLLVGPLIEPQLEDANGLAPTGHRGMGHGPGAQRSFNFFRAADVENACDEWRKLATKPGGSCRKIGNEAVNGRSTIKYEGTSADGDVSYVWIDPKLRFPVKWQGKNDGGEMRNIQEGPQPASLFLVPSDYQKMDMGNMRMPGATPAH